MDSILFTRPGRVRFLFFFPLLLALAAAGANGAGLARGPYLQNLKPDSVTIVWKTGAPTSAASVRFGLSAAYDRSTTSGALALQHAVTLTGLVPAAEYHYRVFDGGEALTPDLTFRSGKGPEWPEFSFVALGDSRSDPASFGAVANRVKSLDPEILLHMGDLVTWGDDLSYWDPEFFEPAKEILSRACLFPAPGNHEASGAAYLEYFYLPPENSGTERYYSFDYGGAHFIALDTLDSYAPGSPQYNWLRADLAARQDRQWIFVFLHYPPYSSGAGHGSDLAVRAALCPVFEEFGVDLVFSGHEHNYERSRVNGIFYIVTGGGGSPLHAVGASQWTQFSASAYHCCQISIGDGGQSLAFRAILPNGALLDSFTLSSPRATAWMLR